MDDLNLNDVYNYTLQDLPPISTVHLEELKKGVMAGSDGALLKKKPKLKKKSKPMKPLMCRDCNKFMGTFVKYDDPKLLEGHCGCLAEASAVNATNENAKVTEHRAEADRHLDQLGHELLGCDRCHADDLDECVCCQTCHRPPSYPHAGHKYEPKGKNIRSRMRSLIDG